MRFGGPYIFLLHERDQLFGSLDQSPNSPAAGSVNKCLGFFNRSVRTGHAAVVALKVRATSSYTP